MNKIIICDFDQTITSEGRDLWYECTKSLSSSSQKFEELIIEFKNTVNDTPIESSLLAFQKGLDLISNKDDIISYFKNVPIDGYLRNDLVEFLNKHLAIEGNQLVISTANYEKGVCTLVPRIFTNTSNIIVSGTRFSKGIVDHINVAQNKVKDIESGIELEHVSHIFGDDPLINDKYILEMKKEVAYLFNTKKNAQYDVAFTRIGDVNEIL
jgi:hypothetical protein